MIQDDNVEQRGHPQGNPGGDGVGVQPERDPGDWDNRAEIKQCVYHLSQVYQDLIQPEGESGDLDRIIGRRLNSVYKYIQNC